MDKAEGSFFLIIYTCAVVKLKRVVTRGSSIDSLQVLPLTLVFLVKAHPGFFLLFLRDDPFASRHPDLSPLQINKVQR